MTVTLLASVMFTAAIAATTSAAIAPATPTVPVRSGMEIRLPETMITDATCTLGAVLSRSRALTAAHCGDVGKAVYTVNGVRIGTITANLANTRRLDVAVITLNRTAAPVVDQTDWSGRFRAGQRVSKDGVTTGRSRGAITDPKPELRGAHGFSLTPPFLKIQETYSVDTGLRSRPGDSGGPVRNGSGAVIGILSSGTSASTTFAPLSRVPGYLR